MKVQEVAGKAAKAGAIGAVAAVGGALKMGLPMDKASIGVIVTALVTAFGHAAWNVIAQALGWETVAPDKSSATATGQLN